MSLAIRPDFSMPAAPVTSPASAPAPLAPDRASASSLPAKPGFAPKPLPRAAHDDAPGAAPDDAPETPAETPDVADLIDQLQSKQRDPKQLTSRQRRQCVDHLIAAGFTSQDVAQFMRISVRTVTRERARLRRLGAIAPGVELGDHLLGEFARQTDATIQRLTRLATEPSTPPYVRLWAEEAISRISQRYFEAARRAGYIEDGSRRIKAELKQRHVARCRAEGRDPNELPPLPTFPAYPFPRR